MQSRLARRSDLAELRALMDAAISELQAPFLDAAQIASSRTIMGVDTQLIDDGTYFVVERDGEIAGCGGWSRRATLYGGDQTPGRSPARLDPATDAARIRAMYTHPRHARRGVGRLILQLCEAAARAEGFTRAELMATLAGEPLYRACGYAPVERVADARGGAPVPLIRMMKSLLLLSVLALCGPTTVTAAQDQMIKIDAARGTAREQQTKLALEKILTGDALKKYTFTRRVVIEEGAVNHAFPALTLNVRFAEAPDLLLSSFVHEQLHWHIRDRPAQQQAAVAELRQRYPDAPVGLPQGAANAFSTYGHLITCYLEIVALRELIGPERAKAAVEGKGNYTWIYGTVLRDERQIAELVDRHRLRLR